MYQGYGQQPVRAPQNYFSMQPQQTALKGRPVSSLEEVRATGIDFDGSVFYFPDIANKRIYTKQIGMDGTAILNMYEQMEALVLGLVTMIQKPSISVMKHLAIN